MAEITKPSNLGLIWASAGDILNPGDTKYQTGWQVEIPPRQWENYIQNKQDQALAHINQHGVPVWDNVTEYQTNKSYVQGPTNGTIYQCILTNTNQNPETDVTNTYWIVAFAAAGTFYTKAEADTKFLDAASNLSDLTNTATARTNLSVYSQAQTYTKTEVDGKTTVASTAQAQALTSNTVLLTPLRLAEALAGGNQSLTGIGYQKLPGGLIIQWGSGATTTGNKDNVPLPVSFPKAFLQAVVVEGNASGWGSPPTPTIHGVTLTGSLSSFAVSAVRLTNTGTSSYSSGISFRWFAVGY